VNGAQVPTDPDRYPEPVLLRPFGFAAPKARGSASPELRVIQELIRDVPDFPKQGIVFKDITPLLQSADGLKQTIAGLARGLDARSFDVVCAIESRGFIFGSALAHSLDKGFVPIRKPGKLPWKCQSESYQLEYGTDRIEIHEDAVRPGQGVLLVDDVLATGGTMAAALKLVRRLGAEVVACSFVIELGFLEGRKRLEGVPVHALIRY
jgi:adenine phosphoribosyltransferase